MVKTWNICVVTQYHTSHPRILSTIQQQTFQNDRARSGYLSKFSPKESLCGKDYCWIQQKPFVLTKLWPSTASFPEKKCDIWLDVLSEKRVGGNFFTIAGRERDAARRQPAAMGFPFHSIAASSQHQQQPFVFGNTLHQDYYICMLFQTAMEKAASNYVD